MDLLQEILRTVRQYEMLAPGDRVLVAVSGGPDSVFLLHSLLSLSRTLKLDAIVVAHLDHGLRVRASAADARFVGRLCKGLGVRCVTKRVRLARSASGKLSTEELAREARYSFLSAAAAKTRCNVIATGHTLDDQAETVLMRVIKGASLKGLAGVPPVRDEKGSRIVRPLLALEKDEIRRSLDSSRLTYRIDETNSSPLYFRNIVRSDIIPFLTRYNPRLKRSLSALASHVREDLEFITAAKLKYQRSTNGGKNKQNRFELPLAKLVIQPAALQKEILRDALEAAGGEVKRLTFRHWKDLESLLRTKGKGRSLDLPGSIRATRREKTLEFARL